MKTAAAESARNHLRATAENNREIVRYYYQQSLSGQLSEKEAMAAAGKVLLSQCREDGLPLRVRYSKRPRIHLARRASQDSGTGRLRC